MKIQLKTYNIIVLLILALPLSAEAQNSNHYCYSSNGVVAAAKEGSSEAGIFVLNKGGNAADAATATILALSVADYGPFCLGGEAPLMIYDSGKKEVFVYSGMGTAPLDPIAIEWYYKNGIPYNDIKSAAVPCIIDLCVQVLINHGTMKFVEVAEPAIKLLSSIDQSWSEDLAKTFKKLIEAENKANSGNRERGLKEVSKRFYKEDIAEDLEQWYSMKGGFLTTNDLANYTTRIEKPLRINYKGYEILKCDTWTQGAYLLQTLKLLENFDLKSMGFGSAEYIHTLTETMKLSLADRDKYYGDPLFVEVPIDHLLSDEYAELRRELVNKNKAINYPRPGNLQKEGSLNEGKKFEKWPGGTTTCVVADRYGNLVVATPSGWGSNAGSGGNTGITHGTRLISFNTKIGHPNCIQPGKRPRITLTPTIVLKDNLPFMGISVEGGDVQDQATLQILLNIIEFGMTPSEAINAPRIATMLHEDSFNPSHNRQETIDQSPRLLINNDFDNQTIEILTNKGHMIDTTSNAVGVPAIVLIDAAGIKHAATDQKTDHYVNKLD
jgi:gamma-glutamyltranspeptidase/glutathione hydrolase